MKDPIDRQDAIDIANDLRSCISVNGYWMWVERLKKLPSAQPEIIHCAECKWFQCNMRPDGTLPKGVDEYECRHWCGFCDPEDFCSYAERRTNEGSD